MIDCMCEGYNLTVKVFNNNSIYRFHKEETNI